jgi:hypothetical protein
LLPDIVDSSSPGRPYSPRWVSTKTVGRRSFPSPRAQGFGGEVAYYGTLDVELINPPDLSSLSSLLPNVAFAIWGTVTDVREGFFYDVPGALLKIRIDEELVQWPEGPRRTSFLLYYPVADFEVGGVHFRKGDPRYPAMAAVGDRVIYLAYGKPLPVRGEALVFPFGKGEFALFKGPAAVVRTDVFQSDRNLQPLESPEALKAEIQDALGRLSISPSSAQ